MQRLVYFIFIMPFTQSFAMETGPSAPGNRIITVANVTEHGVTVQVCQPNKDQQGDGNKVWIGTIRRRQLEVSPPQSPSLVHSLVVKNTNETEELARTDFAHPKDDDTLFKVSKFQGVVSVEQTDDPTKSEKSIQSQQPTQSLVRTLAVPSAGAVVLVLALLAAKKYAATE